MFDIFEPDTRDAAVGNEITSSVCGFVPIATPSSSAMPAQPSSTTSTMAQTEEAVTDTRNAVLQPIDLYAEDIYIGSLADFGPGDDIKVPENETTNASQESASIPPESTKASKGLISTTADSATACRSPVGQQTTRSVQVSASSASEQLKSSSPPSNSLSGAAIKRFLEMIPFREHYPDSDLVQLRDSIKSYEHCIEKAEKASDGMFNSITELDWKIRKKKAFISLVVREQGNKKPAKKGRPRVTFPFVVIQGKNATDPDICNDPQNSPAVSDFHAELQKAVEGWRDTVDGRAEDYRDTTYGTHRWKPMEHEDFEGTDNNEYPDYFPEEPRKVVYHSTAVQTRLITTPLMYKKIYGKELTSVESRKIMRTIGSVDYVDQSQIRYGKPFLGPNRPYLDIQTKNQDSGFQIMDFEVREANVLKAKAKAGITASKLNKISIERDNGIQVFAEPSKNRIVHSQQFNAIRAIIDRAGTVESYGSFTPMIHNVVYEEIQNKPVTTAVHTHATSLAHPHSRNLVQPTTPNMEVTEPKKIPSYCRSPSPGLYEDVQSTRPGLFENGWPMDQFSPPEVDGTYSLDVSKDFGVPNTKHRHKSTREIARTAIHADTKVHCNSASISKQETPNDRIASEAAMPPPSRKSQRTPTQQEGQGRTRKRSMGQGSDEGYKSHSPLESPYKRQRLEKSTTASSSHFPTSYSTLLTSEALKLSTPTSNGIDTTTPKTDDMPAPSAQTSNKRKRDASSTQDPSDDIKRPRLQPTPTPVRRLPPTESTLKVINPKGILKPRAPANQKNSLPTVAQASRVAPPVDAHATLSKVQPKEPPPKQIQLPMPAAPVSAPAKATAPAPAPAPAPPRPAWADRKPTANRDNKKENPNRWRINLGAASLGRRHDPYNASGRPSRRR